MKFPTTQDAEEYMEANALRATEYLSVNGGHRINVVATRDVHGTVKVYDPEKGRTVRRKQLIHPQGAPLTLRVDAQPEEK